MGTNVPATAVAGQLVMVPVVPEFPAKSVYVMVVLVTGEPFVVAVLTRIAANTPSPLELALRSRAGSPGWVMDWPVVVVSAIVSFHHNISINVTPPTEPPCIML